jgi:hypothetical protein
MQTRTLSLIFLLGLLLLSALFGNLQPVSAQPQANIQGLPWNGNPIVIPAAAFGRDGGPSTNVFFSFIGFWRGNSSGCITAPIYLPRYARLTYLFVSTMDNDASNNLWLNLYRVDNYSGTVETLGGISSSGQSTDILVLYDTLNTAVEYPNYSYYLGSCLLSSNHRLYSVRVYFDLNRVFMPAIAK